MNSKDSSSDEQPSSKEAMLSSKEVKASLKASIKTAVESTNKMLASMEQQSQKIAKPLVTNAEKIQSKAQVVAQKASKAYDVRHEYGPYIVSGTALVLGGIAGLRRGKLPGLTIGAITGFGAYLGVYELDLKRFPSDVLSGAKKD